MISDRLEHVVRWPLGRAWQEIGAELMRLIARGPDLPEGEYPLPHEARAVVQVYVSRNTDEAAYENHSLMADIQTVLDGEEYLYVIDASGLTPDRERDGNGIEFFRETPPPTSRILLRPGIFALILPGEAHMPCLAVDTPRTVKKMVVKIRADLLSPAEGSAVG